MLTGISSRRRDVSPIDELPDKSGFDQQPTRQASTSQPKSNIPMMRRQRRQTQEAAAATLRETKSRERLRDRSQQQQGVSSDAAAAYPGGPSTQTATGRQVFKMAKGREMKWDAMTGEPTLGPKGYSAQVKPAEYAQEFGTHSNPASSALSRLRSAQNNFSDKVRRIRGGESTGPSSPSGIPTRSAPLSPEPEPRVPERSPTAPPVQVSATARPPRNSSLTARPEWKGGSGRVALVDPVHDTPQDPPLHIPRKSSKRSPNVSRGARGGPGGPLSLSPVSPSGSETSLSRPDDPTTTTATRKPIPSPLASPDPSISTRAPGKDYPSPPNSGSAIPGSYATGPSSPIQPVTGSLPNYHLDSAPATAAPAPIPSSTINIDATKAIRRKPATSTTAAPTTSSPPTASNAGTTATNRPPAHHNPHFSTASSVYSQFDPAPINYSNVTTNVSNITVTTHSPASGPATQPAATVAEDNWVQPPSRFSVTTYATSAHTGSPSLSIDADRPPMPTPPQAFSQLQTTSSSPSRKDNVVITMNQPYMSSPYTTSSPDRAKAAKPMGPRDAIPNYVRSNTWGDSGSSVFGNDGRPGSVASTSKALPPAPPEARHGNDRVGYLNARLESLANRRININRSIKKMTEMMPTDNLMASDAVLKKREIEKIKIEGLKLELSEVQREEYELGLKLHRAYKRQDREAEFEPTTLWVRRAGS